VSVIDIVALASPPRALSRRSTRPPVAAAALPEVAPGQIWLLELPGDRVAGAVELRRVLVQANVAIYDRAVGGLVAVTLPPGGYAEAADDSGDRAAERAVCLARDGWSVVRLSPAPASQRARAERARRLVAALADARNRAGAGARIYLDGAEVESVPLDRLAQHIALVPREASPIVVIEPVGGAAARAQVVGGNGLAG